MVLMWMEYLILIAGLHKFSEVLKEVGIKAFELLEVPSSSRSHVVVFNWKAEVVLDTLVLIFKVDD